MSSKNKFSVLIVLLAVSGLILPLAPAHAVHQCGAQHSGYGGGYDDDDDDDRYYHHHYHRNGCSEVKASDFLDGDARIDAPELAQRGDYTVGVRTLRVVNRNQIDILNWSVENPNPVYNRRLKLEVWYPARLYYRDRELTTYKDVLGSGAGDPDRPLRPFEFAGRAARGAMPNLDGGPYPLVIVSHGYPGSRVLMTYLTENLASKGYVVVAIDHTESTHADKAGFSSTLLNRTLDINFVLRKMARKSNRGRGFLSGMVDADRTTVVGYSMGGYGALNAAGAGYSPIVVNFVPGGHLARLQEGTAAYAEELDPRIRAMVAFAPWGGAFGVWTPTALAGIDIPSLFIVGKQDQTSGYAAVRGLFNAAVNSDRYLLAYESAIHEIAPNPAPPLAEQHYREYIHCQEPAWDNRRLNNINQHFITAFLGVHIQGDFARYQPYLDLVQFSNDSNRTDESDPSYWKGFPNYSAIGMELEHLLPQ